MTVVLVGVGADSENVSPPPSIDEEGYYEYIPIPETWLTTEERSFGNYQLEHSEGTAADYIDEITPFGDDGDSITNDKIINNHPFHFDPDFEAMTFADRRGGTGSTLAKKLTEGDGLGFYTGLKGPNGHLHRYIYGFFTVKEVADLSELEKGAYRDRLRDHPENAHAKRLAGSGKPKHYDLVVVDGKEPALRLDSPVQISKRRDDPPPTYQLTERMSDTLEIQNGPVVMDRKPALISSLSPEKFLHQLEVISK